MFSIDFRWCHRGEFVEQNHHLLQFVIISFILMTLMFYSRMVFKGEIKYSGIEGGGGGEEEEGRGIGVCGIGLFSCSILLILISYNLWYSSILWMCRIHFFSIFSFKYSTAFWAFSSFQLFHKQAEIGNNLTHCSSKKSLLVLSVFFFLSLNITYRVVILMDEIEFQVVIEVLWYLPNLL